MSIHMYNAPTGAEPEIYHKIHDAIRMLANAAGLLKRAEQAALEAHIGRKELQRDEAAIARREMAREAA